MSGTVDADTVRAASPVPVDDDVPDTTGVVTT